MEDDLCHMVPPVGARGVTLIETNLSLMVVGQEGPGGGVGRLHSIKGAWWGRGKYKGHRACPGGKALVMETPG